MIHYYKSVIRNYDQESSPMFLNSKILNSPTGSSIASNLIKKFDPYEPLRIPFECEHCHFFTTDAILAAEHSDSHNELATKTISRWEPSTIPIPVSVIVPNPAF